MLDYSYSIDMEFKINRTKTDPEDSLSSLIDSINCTSSFVSLILTSSEYLGFGSFRIFCDGEESDIDFCDDIEAFLDSLLDNSIDMEAGSEIKRISTHPINPVCFSWVYENEGWDFYESVDHSYGFGANDYDDFD